WPDLFRRDHPASAADRTAGHGQLPGRHLQGYADAVGDRRGRVDACRHRDRLADLPLSRALHDGRRHLSGDLAAGRACDQDVRGLGAPLAGHGENTMTDFPLTLEDGPIVRFADVTKRFGDLTVIDHLDLDVQEGEMVTIIGPSGSGKTTVL